MKISTEKKNIYFQNIKLIFNSIFYKDSKEFAFARISLKKLIFEHSVWRKDDTKGGPLSTFLRISREKKNIYFQNIKLTFNSIFYKKSKEFTFARISRKKLLFEHPVWREDDTKGGPLSPFLRISRKKNF